MMKVLDERLLHRNGTEIFVEVSVDADYGVGCVSVVMPGDDGVHETCTFPFSLSEK